MMCIRTPILLRSEGSICSCHCLWLRLNDTFLMSVNLLDISRTKIIGIAWLRSKSSMMRVRANRWLGVAGSWSDGLNANYKRLSPSTPEPKNQDEGIIN